MARAERRPGGASELTASGGMCSSLDPRATAAGVQMLMPSFRAGVAVRHRITPIGLQPIFAKTRPRNNRKGRSL
jgi:hypothetical protein